MTIEQLIQNRKSLTDIQEHNLIQVLSYRCSAEVKMAVKKAIKYKFYTLFEGEEFARRFSIIGNDIEYSAKDSSNFNNELSTIRRRLLNVKQ